MACHKTSSRRQSLLEGRVIGLKTLKLFTVLLAISTLCACISHGRQHEILQVADNANIPKKELTIALLGATGMVGSFILSEALAQGYDVRALARTPAKLAALRGHITVIGGDARDPIAINQLLQGSDVVISALGPVRADGEGAKMLGTTATGLILQSMQTHNIERYIVISGAAVETPGDDRTLTGWLLKQSASITLRETLKDKQSEYELLGNSAAQWTLVRCPLIEPQPYVHAPRASLESPTSFKLRAGELARFVIQQIDSETFYRQAPFLSSQ